MVFQPYSFLLKGLLGEMNPSWWLRKHLDSENHIEDTTQVQDLIFNWTHNPLEDSKSFITKGGNEEETQFKKKIREEKPGTQTGPQQMDTEQVRVILTESNKKRVESLFQIFCAALDFHLFSSQCSQVSHCFLSSPAVMQLPAGSHVFHKEQLPVWSSHSPPEFTHYGGSWNSPGGGTTS